MQLLVIRHAIAEDREDFAATGRDDSERPLTRIGKRRMRRNARGLARIAPAITKVATSPYVRAMETARIVADEFGVQDDIVTVDALTPDHMSEALLPFLSALPPDANVAIVGHEPHLGRLVTWLMASASESHVMFKKGGVALLDLGVRPSAGSAILQWVLTPGQLRAIAD